jgi:membrane-bound serine protease (ClpP class)
MAPGTTIGAAHPVQIGGLPIQPHDDSSAPEAVDRSLDKETPARRTAMEDKIVNDTVAWARTLAEQRDRNSDWAARAVSESLSVAASTAVQEGVVDLEAADLDELVRRLNGRSVALPGGPHVLRTSGAEVKEVAMWWGERVLAILSRPNITFLLLIFGFYGVLFELYSPGWGVSGTLGVICLLLALFGLSVLPVSYLGLALIVLALGLFTAEVFVTSFGALTLAGLVCLALGGVMLVDSPIGFLRVSFGVVGPLAAATGVITVFLVSTIVSAHRRRATTGDEALLGTTAQARGTFVRRGNQFVGTVFTHGERWTAVSEKPVRAEQTCVVQGRQDLTLVVEPSEVPSGET